MHAKGFAALVIGVSLVFCPSCGYRFSNKTSFENPSTFNIPYIKGDVDGTLTSSMIKELSTDPLWRYDPNHPTYILDIEIIKNQDTHIGYQYDRIHSTAELINRLIPIEGRKKIIVKVQLIDSKNGSILQGPYEVESYGDYDFVNFDTYKDLAFVDNQGKPQSVLSYSLGQLDAIEGAQESVLSALYQDLIKKIVLGLGNL